MSSTTVSSFSMSGETPKNVAMIDLTREAVPARRSNLLSVISVRALQVRGNWSPKPASRLQILRLSRHDIDQHIFVSRYPTVSPFIYLFSRPQLRVEAKIEKNLICLPFRNIERDLTLRVKYGVGRSVRKPYRHSK